MPEPQVGSVGRSRVSRAEVVSATPSLESLPLLNPPPQNAPIRPTQSRPYICPLFLQPPEIKSWNSSQSPLARPQL